MYNYSDILIHFNVLYKYYNIIISIKPDVNKHKLKYYDVLNMFSKYNIDEKYIKFDVEPKWLYCEFSITSSYMTEKNEYIESYNFFEKIIFNDLLVNDANLFNISLLEIYYGFLLNEKKSFSDVEIVEFNDKLFVPHNITDYSILIFQKSTKNTPFKFLNTYFKITEKLYQLASINKKINCIILTNSKSEFKNSKKVKYFIRKEKMFSILKKFI